MGLNRTFAALLASACLVVTSCSVADDSATPSTVAFNDSTTSAVVETTEAPTTEETVDETSETTETSEASTTTSTSSTSTTVATTTPTCTGPETSDSYEVFNVNDQLNIRSGPGTEFDVVGELGRLDRDVTLTTGCVKTGEIVWWKLANGSGWVASNYLKVQGNSVCSSGTFDSTGATQVKTNTGEVDGDGLLDTVYTFIRNGELTVAAELGDGGYIETSYVESNDGSGFIYGYPADLDNIRAIRPASRTTDVLIANSSNNQLYMFGYRMCELPLFGGLETDGPFGFELLNTPALSQRLVCTLSPTGTTLHLHRFGTDLPNEQLQKIKWDNTYFGAGFEMPPVQPDPNTQYWAC